MSENKEWIRKLGPMLIESVELVMEFETGERLPDGSKKTISVVIDKRSNTDLERLKIWDEFNTKKPEKKKKS